MDTQCRLDLSSHLQGGPITVRGGADWHQYAIAVAGVGAVAGAAYALSNAGGDPSGDGCTVPVGGASTAVVSMKDVTVFQLAKSIQVQPLSMSLGLAGNASEVTACRAALSSVPNSDTALGFAVALQGAATSCGNVRMTKQDDPSCAIAISELDLEAVGNAGGGGGGGGELGVTDAGGGGGGVDCIVTLGGTSTAEADINDVTFADLAQSVKSPASNWALSGDSEKVSKCHKALLGVLPKVPIPAPDATDDVDKYTNYGTYYNSLFTAAFACAIPGINLGKLDTPACSIPFTSLRNPHGQPGGGCHITLDGTSTAEVAINDVTWAEMAQALSSGTASPSNWTLTGDTPDAARTAAACMTALGQVGSDPSGYRDRLDIAIDACNSDVNLTKTPQGPTAQKDPNCSVNVMGLQLGVEGF